MIRIFLLLFIASTTLLFAGKPCGNFKVAGYLVSDTTITRLQAISLISSPIIAKDDCGVKIKNRSAYLIIMNEKKEVLQELRFNGAIHTEDREKVISKILPGNIFRFEEWKFGDENKRLPSLTITIKAG